MRWAENVVQHVWAGGVCASENAGKQRRGRRYETNRGWLPRDSSKYSVRILQTRMLQRRPPVVEIAAGKFFVSSLMPWGMLAERAPLSLIESESSS